MPLVSAKCTNCEANVKVESTKDAAICPYCSMPYIVEKAINYYNSKNNISSEITNVYGNNSADFVIRAGELMQYNGASVDVVIPDNVVLIGENAFKNCRGLVHVLIPNSVVSIGNNAFSGCSSLVDITIPDSVTSIGGNAFEGCISLVNVTIPNSVTSIGYHAFKDCGNLVNIAIPNSISYIGGVFEGCSNLANVSIPNSIISIGHNTFKDCSSLTNIKIPTSVIKIEESAFFKSGLKEISIPENVQVICDKAFGQCDSLEKVILPSHHMDIAAHDYDPYGESIDRDAAFCHCINLAKVINGDIYDVRCFYHTPYSEQRLQQSKQQSNGGCYIATAVYGSYDCKPVWTLRRYRDFVLSKHWYGRTFIHIYYAVSPAAVKYFGHTAWFKSTCKAVLNRIVTKLNAEGIKNTPYKDINW